MKQATNVDIKLVTKMNIIIHSQIIKHYHHLNEAFFIKYRWLLRRLGSRLISKIVLTILTLSLLFS